MTSEAPTPIPSRETLAGDRLCMRCLHPLVGRAIERDPQTGLLFVRCGECATASALFEYPTAAPWINRLKAVAASILTVLTLAVFAAIAGVTGGASAIIGEYLTDQTATALMRLHESTQVGSVDKSIVGFNPWFPADQEYLASPLGAAALKSAPFSFEVVLAYIMTVGLASVIVTPFALVVGIAFSRHAPSRRAFLSVVPVLVGTVLAFMVSLLNSAAAASKIGMQTWLDFATVHYTGKFVVAAALWMLVYVSMVAMVAPSCAALLARVVLPARDRRLVAWLWEWRGKPVPKN